MEGCSTPVTTTTWDQIWRMAEGLAQAQCLPQELRGKTADIAAVIAAGAELGVGPMTALANMAPSKGKITISSALAAGLVRKSAQCQYLTLIETTDAKATWRTQRTGAPAPVELSWTIEEAKRAGLLSKDIWRSYPAAMLRARCQMALSRLEYPDVMAGLYLDDEVEESGPAARYTAPTGSPEPAAPPPAPAERQTIPPGTMIPGPTMVSPELAAMAAMASPPLATQPAPASTPMVSRDRVDPAHVAETAAREAQQPTTNEVATDHPTADTRDGAPAPAAAPTPAVPTVQWILASLKEWRQDHGSTHPKAVEMGLAKVADVEKLTPEQRLALARALKEG